MRAAILLLIIILSGCGLVYDKQVRDEVLSRDLQPEIRQAIINKKIRVGMTKEEVLASWGRPCGYCRGTYKTSHGEWWEYNVFGSGSYGIGSGTYLFFNSTGVLQYWSN